MSRSNSADNKNIFRIFGRVFLRTIENNRFYDITECRPLHDGTIEDNDGVLVGAFQVSVEYVVGLLETQNLIRLQANARTYKRIKRKKRQLISASDLKEVAK